MFKFELTDGLIFSRSRRMPQWMRNLLLRAYPVYLDIKHFLQYRTTNMFETVCIESHSQCNRKCTYCPNFKHTRPKTVLDLAHIEKVASELAAAKFRGDIALTGYNEPLMDKRTDEIVDIIRKYLPHNVISVYTNGDFLTPRLFDRLLEAGVFLYVTIHQQAEITNPELREIYENATHAEKRQFHLKFNIDSDILSTRCGAVEVENPEHQARCIMPYAEFHVVCDGSVILCCDDYFRTVTFGNIKTERALDIWHKPHYTKIRRELRHGRASLPICRKCLGLAEENAAKEREESAE